MPTDRIHVHRVDFSGLVKGHLKAWLVTGTHTDGTLGGFQASTLSPFAATLCERAREEGYDVLIQWREIPQGKGITYVELAPEEEGAA